MFILRPSRLSSVEILLARGARTIVGWWGCKSSGTSSRLFYMHYCEYRTFKSLSAPMCRRCYIFMIAVLEGVESLTLEHTIWLYLHPIPHCRAQRFASCASAQVMNAVLFSDAVCVIYCLAIFYGISVQVGNVP